MSGVLREIVEDIVLYNGKSFLMLFFLAALLFLWVMEKDKKLRAVLVYLVTASAVLFACPFYAWIGMKFDVDIYYRVIWSLPMGLLFCYSVVKLMARAEHAVAKALVLLLAVTAIVLNGDLVYTKTLHFKAGNSYHVPQVVLDVADALQLDAYRPIAVMPAELLPFLRQYTADIYTPYGRNILEPAWTFENELFDAMEGDIYSYDAVRIAQCARGEHCAFVVLSGDKQILGSMEEQGYFLFRSVHKYHIYMDWAYYDIYKEQGLLDADVIETAEQKRSERRN